MMEKMEFTIREFDITAGGRWVEEKVRFVCAVRGRQTMGTTELTLLELPGATFRVLEKVRDGATTLRPFTGGTLPLAARDYSVGLSAAQVAAAYPSFADLVTTVRFL